jgi:hypothetical protein
MSGLILTFVSQKYDKAPRKTRAINDMKNINDRVLNGSTPLIRDIEDKIKQNAKDHFLSWNM